jgi:hypothetical protein
MRRWLPLAFSPLPRLIEYGVEFVHRAVMVAVESIFDVIKLGLEPKSNVLVETLQLLLTVAVKLEPEALVEPPVGQVPVPGVY